VSLDIPLCLKKKVGGGCALPGADMQKPYAQNVSKEKNRPISGFFTKIAYFQVMNFIPVKVSTLYRRYTSILIYSWYFNHSYTPVPRILPFPKSIFWLRW
jgi:hypothetical protein